MTTHITVLRAALKALKHCLPIVKDDAQMMADITRFAPLPFEEQVKHDTTITDSERLVDELPNLITLCEEALKIEPDDSLAARIAELESQAAHRKQLHEAEVADLVAERDALKAEQLTRLEALSQYTVALEQERDALRGVANEHRDGRLAALEENAALKADAARYRWCIEANMILAGGERFAWRIAPIGKEWTRYIDNAIATEQK